MRDIWMRLGISVSITEDEEQEIFNGDAGKVLSAAIAAGRFETAGDSYIPGPAIEEFDGEYGTSHGVDRGNGYPVYEDMDVGITTEPCEAKELNYLLNFAGQSDLSEDINRDWLRMLWTSFCLHDGLTVDTAGYDGIVRRLWDVVSEEDTADWKDFDEFDNFLAKYLV